MKVAFVVVPVGGGEANFSFEADLQGVPEMGDFVQILDLEQKGYEYYIVRRKTFCFEANPIPDGREIAFQCCAVEVEFATGDSLTANHKIQCDAYTRKGVVLQEYQASGH